MDKPKRPKVWHDNKLRIIPVNASSLLNFLHGNVPMYLTNIPRDAQILSIGYDMQKNVFTLLVHSNTFLAISGGDIPFFNLQASSLLKPEEVAEAQRDACLAALDFQYKLLQGFADVGAFKIDNAPSDPGYLVEYLADLDRENEILLAIACGVYNDKVIFTSNIDMTRIKEYRTFRFFWHEDEKHRYADVKALSSADAEANFFAVRQHHVDKVLLMHEPTAIDKSDN